jgi:hypothetical protein
MEHTSNSYLAAVGAPRSDHERGLLGARLGLGLGAAYGLVAGSVNAVVLWGVPIRVEPGDVAMNMITSGLSSMLAGYITARPHSSLRGVISGALAAALFQTGLAFFNLGGDALQRVGVSFILVTLFLPLAALFLVITSLLRLGSNWYEEALSYTGRPRLRRMARLWLGVAVLAAIAGSTAQLGEDEQAALRQIHAMLQQALTADDQALPDPLRSIDEFRDRASQAYLLSASTDFSADASITGSTSERYVNVEVAFESGLTIHCTVGQTLGQPVCSER